MDWLGIAVIATAVGLMLASLLAIALFDHKK